MKRTRKLLCLLLALVFLSGLLPCVEPVHAHAEPPYSAVGDCDDGEAHNWTIHAPNTATCTEGGTIHWVCSKCNREYMEQSAAMGHSFTNWTTTKAAGCSVPGEQQALCDNGCGETAVEPIPALGHDWGEWTLRPGSAPADCIHGSMETRSCSRCDTTETHDVPALGHDYTSAVSREPGCAEEGVRSYTCSRCGDSYTEPISAAGHDYTSTVTREPGCTEEGVRSYTCSRCGENYAEPIQALGHDEREEVTRQPSCTDKGERTLTCSRCDNERTESIDKLGHEWDDGETTEPQGLTDGQILFSCSRCEETKTQIVPAAPAVFRLLRKLPAEAASADKLIITREPADAAMPYGDRVRLNIEAAGGTPPYTYEWRRRADTADTALSGWLQTCGEQISSQFSSRRKDYAAAFAAISAAYHTEDSIEYKSLYTPGGSAYAQAMTSGKLRLLDRVVGTSDTPDFEADSAGRYYCVVRDAAGREAESKTVELSYELYILSQPQSTNLAGRDSVALSCVAAGGKPQKNSGLPYTFQWYKQDGTSLESTQATVSVSEPGEYYCVVSDAARAAVTSETATVYDEAPSAAQEPRESALPTNLGASGPMITRQPESVELDYRADGQYGQVFACEALSPDTGDDSRLRYEWQVLDETFAWVPVYGASAFSVPTPLIGYPFRCKVVDERTGEYLCSDIVTAAVKLKFVGSELSDQDTVVLRFVGGTGPFGCEVHRMAVGELPCTPRFDLEEKDGGITVTLKKVEGYIRFKHDPQYKDVEYPCSFHVLVTDATGQQVWGSYQFPRKD